MRELSLHSRGNLIEKYPVAWSFILTIASIGSIVIVVMIDMICILALVRYLTKQNGVESVQI